MSISEFGLYAVNINKVINILGKSYVKLINSAKPFKSFPSVMLWGAPGVGKSDGVRGIGEYIEKHTDKKVCITDVRLLLFNPVDLRGIPTSNEDKTLAVWLKPKIFHMDESEDVVNILFLDEISSAPPSVQSAAYQITLDRVVGEHRLPENCIVIAAGNRVTDKSVAYNMPKALANRLCHFEVTGDSDAWHIWAVKKGIHHFVTGYIEYNSPALMKFDPLSTSLAFPTPRSWEMVSNILNNISEDVTAVYPMIAGCIGHSSAGALKSWAEIYKKLPDVEKIFSGEEEKVPKEPELQTALRSLMVSYARMHPEKELIDNSIDYSCRLPWTFRKMLFRDYYCIEEVKYVAQTNEIFNTARETGLR